MGQTRQQPQAQPQRSFPEAEAAIALILIGAVVVPNPLATITLILTETLRSVKVPSVDLDSIARSAAGMAIRENVDSEGAAGGSQATSGAGGTSLRGEAGAGDNQAGPSDGPFSTAGRVGSEDADADTGGPGISGATSLLSDIRIENAIRRAQFVIGAARRMALRIRNGMPISESILQEEFNFRLHRQAQAQRLSATELQVNLIETYGTTKFGWNHSKKERFRPTHKRADGKVYDAIFPPKSTMGLPATLIHCGCSGTPLPQETPVTLI